jgi:hypothetical protein
LAKHEQYILLANEGVLLSLLSHLLVGRIPVKIKPGSEYVEHFLVINYRLFTMFLFVVAALRLRYFFTLNAWVAGLWVIAFGFDY